MLQGSVVRLPTWAPGIVAVSAATAQVFARHTHDQHGLGAVVRGGHGSASGRGPVEAGPGDMITVNPGEVHDGRPLGEGGRVWKMLYLDPPVVTAALLDLSEGRFATAEFAQPVIPRPGLAAGLLRVFEALTTPVETVGRLGGEAMLLAVLAGVLHPGEGRGVPAALRLAVQRLDEAPEEPVSLDDLARLTGLGRFQVVRGFVRATGLPPHAYLMQRRLQRARRLLLAGLPVAEVALACGFADQSHLTRLFKRGFGLPPGAYATAGRLQEPSRRSELGRKD